MTFALVAINVILFLGVGRGALKADVRALVALDEAAGYWVQHPYLELDESVREALRKQYGPERFDVIAAALDSPLNRPPEDPEVREREQLLLDQLVGVYKRALDAQPFLRWGLVPGQFSLVALLTSMFMHAGWLHLLGNMFILYLAAPSVEDAYGRPLFVGFYLLSGVVASVVHVVLHPDSMVPLVGASGAIAGVMGAFLVRFTRTRIKFFYWFGLIFRGTFSAPAWMMLPLWLLEQLFYGMLVKSADGVAYWAHVGGFVFGAAAAYAIRLLAIEEKYVHPRIEAAISITQHPALEAGMALLEQRNFADARASFHEVLAIDPRNVDAHLGLWEAYAQDENPVAGAGHLARVVENDLRVGDLRLAFDHWREGHHAGATLPATIAFRLGAQLAEAGSPEAMEVLQAVASDGGAGMLASKAAARCAEIAPTDEDRQTWKAEAARLESAGVPHSEPRARASAPVAVAAVQGRRSDAPAEPAATPPRTASPGSDPAGGTETGAGGAGNGETQPVVPPAGPPRVVRKGLKRLHPSGLAFANGSAEEIVRYDWVEAVGVAGVSDGARRYLLADMVLRPSRGGSRVVVRMVSSDFDPRAVMELPDLPPFEAFREFVRLVVSASRARLLPDPSFLGGGEVSVFHSLAEYEQKVFAALG